MSMRKEYWEMGNGKRIAIKDMETSHIKNCIKKINNSNWRTEYLESLEEELKNRNLALTEVNERGKFETVNNKEKIYFIKTSCELDVLDPFHKDELPFLPDPPYTSKGTRLSKEKKEDFMTNNVFVFDPDKISKEQFRSELIDDFKKMEDIPFYDKYNPTLLDNVFTKEWKSFIDLMLGRR